MWEEAHAAFECLSFLSYVSLMRLLSTDKESRAQPEGNVCVCGGEKDGGH